MSCCSDRALLSSASIDSTCSRSSVNSVEPPTALRREIIRRRTLSYIESISCILSKATFASTFIPNPVTIYAGTPATVSQAKNRRRAPDMRLTVPNGRKRRHRYLRCRTIALFRPFIGVGKVTVDLAAGHSRWHTSLWNTVSGGNVAPFLRLWGPSIAFIITFLYLLKQKGNGGESSQCGIALLVDFRNNRV